MIYEGEHYRWLSPAETAPLDLVPDLVRSEAWIDYYIDRWHGTWPYGAGLPRSAVAPRETDVPASGV